MKFITGGSTGAGRGNNGRPSQSNFFHFYAVFGIKQNNSFSRPLSELAPPGSPGSATVFFEGS